MSKTQMTPSVLNSIRDRPLHYCMYDTHGTPLHASYPLGEDAVDVPSAVRAGYGVQPHPDMPCGVYSRMEQRLELSNGAAGYYYCLDANGRVVWISVSLYPTKNGLVACHFQVVSPYLAHLAQFYKQLRTEEDARFQGSQSDQMDREEAAAELLALLTKEGLPDYRAMALSVMVDEVFVRYDGCGRPQFDELKSLYTMHETLRVIDELGADVGIVSERSKLIPYQLKLQAARLESGKGPISVIASNHQELTASLLEITRDIHRSSSTEIDKVSDALAYLAQSNHAAELLSMGKTSAQRTPLQPAFQAEMQEIIDDCARQVKTVLSNIDKSAWALIAISKRMRRALCAMEMTRLMCKVERANLDGQTEGLENIVDHLQEVERNLYDVMSKIDDGAKAALTLVKKMNRSATRHAA